MKLSILSKIKLVKCSPVRLVKDPSKRSPHGIIEAKNVIVKDGETLKDALIRKSMCKMFDTGLEVNKSPMHFYRVQQQLFGVNRLRGVLAILGGKREFFHEEIAFQPEWWKEKLMNIEQFYDKYIIYELAYLRVRDGLTRCDYG